MSVMGGLVTARVTGSRVRASLVQGNGQRAKVGTGLGKRVARGVAIIVALVVVCREATMHRVFRLRMASPLLMLAFCASVLLVVTTTVRAAPVLDQSHDPTGKVSGIAITSPPVKQELAQTFTVGFTGQLSNVEVKVARSNEFAGPILLDIRATSGGVPIESNATTLATAIIPAVDIPVIPVGPFDPSVLAFVPVDLSTANLMVNSGDVLAVVLRIEEGAGHAWAASSTPGYDDGAGFVRDDDSNITWTTFNVEVSPPGPLEPADMGFKTFVDSDPLEPFLEFPLVGDTPWTAAVSTVHDHSVKTDKDGVPLYYRNKNGVVQPYAGLPGLRKCGVGDCVQRFGKVSGYKNENGEQFFLDGDINYTGGGGCEVQNNPVDCHFWLFYDGHPGYDYPAPLETDILAPADGFLFVPDSDPITSRSDSSGAVERFNIMAIDHGNGFTTWYLHVGREAGTEGAPPGEQDFRGIMLGDSPIFVEEGDVVGQVGNKGLCSTKEIKKGQCSPALAHLHFEVRTGVSSFLCELPACQVVDPYGPGPRLWLDEPPE